MSESWPRVEAEIRDDGTAVLTIGGHPQLLRAEDEPSLRKQILDTVADHARQLGRPLLTTTTQPQGRWNIIVHPSGQVEEQGVPPELPVAQQSEPVEPSTFAPPSVQQTAPPAAPMQQATPQPFSPAFNAPAPMHAAPAAEPLPTLEDFLRTGSDEIDAPAMRGWRRVVRVGSLGLIKPGPGKEERQERRDVASIQRSLAGPRTICVVNPKGGAGKTTLVLMLAAMFGMQRGGYTLAWDDNETIGNLATRARAARHANTAVDLLRDLERFNDTATGRIGDLDNYVRSQGDARFDALASDLDPAGAATIDADAFHRLHAMLQRFYRIIVIDTGNNPRASNWEAAVEAADQLVIASSLTRDVGLGGAVLIDRLRSLGLEQKVSQAVTLLSHPVKDMPLDEDAKSRRKYFEAHTRVVLDLPYEAAFKDGGALNVGSLSVATRRAWLRAAAEVAEGL